MLLAALLLASTPPPAAPLRLEFCGLSGGGRVVVAVFADERGWKHHKPTAATADLPIQEGCARGDVGGLVPGRYGVMAFQDRNGDGKLTLAPVGIPLEPYGFSNDARGPLGPPAWAAASFVLSPGAGAVQRIRLH